MVLQVWTGLYTLRGETQDVSHLLQCFGVKLQDASLARNTVT
jgi:hypothetical protein